MKNLNLSYQDVDNMPWEYLEWFYQRHNQYLIDLEKEQGELSNRFI